MNKIPTLEELGFSSSDEEMEVKTKDDEGREILEAMLMEEISLKEGEEKLNEMIQNSEVTPDTFDKWGRNLLHNAAIYAKLNDTYETEKRNWFEDFIRRLIKDEGYDPNTREQNSDGKTVLFFFVSGTHDEQFWYTFMKELIEEHGADPLLTIEYGGLERNLRQYIDYQWTYLVAVKDTSDRRREVTVKPFLDYLKAYELRKTGLIKPTDWSVQPSLKL